MLALLLLLAPVAQSIEKTEAVVLPITIDSVSYPQGTGLSCYPYAATACQYFYTGPPPVTVFDGHVDVPSFDTQGGERALVSVEASLQTNYSYSHYAWYFPLAPVTCGSATIHEYGLDESLVPALPEQYLMFAHNTGQLPVVSKALYPNGGSLALYGFATATSSNQDRPITERFLSPGQLLYQATASNGWGGNSDSKYLLEHWLLLQCRHKAKARHRVHIQGPRGAAPAYRRSSQAVVLHMSAQGGHGLARHGCDPEAPRAGLI